MGIKPGVSIFERLFEVSITCLRHKASVLLQADIGLFDTSVLSSPLLGDKLSWLGTSN